ncbi:hypothetical protein AAFF_G00137760, partial [Aldrovandia affinis]
RHIRIPPLFSGRSSGYARQQQPGNRAPYLPRLTLALLLHACIFPFDRGRARCCMLRYLAALDSDAVPHAAVHIFLWTGDCTTTGLTEILSAELHL